MGNWDQGTGGGAFIRLTMDQGTQDFANNRTSVNWSAAFYKGSFNSYSFDAIGWASNIGGNGFGGSFTFDFRVSSGVGLGSGSVWITHNDDGTMSVGGSCSIGATGTSSGGPATASGSLPLSTIPRGPHAESAGAWRQTVAFAEDGMAWRQCLVYAEDGGVWRLAA